jgi:hypothetical protein
MVWHSFFSVHSTTRRCLVNTPTRKDTKITLQYKQYYSIKRHGAGLIQDKINSAT